MRSHEDDRRRPIHGTDTGKSKIMHSNSGVGTVCFGDNRTFNGVKIFSATMAAERDRLGEKITAWIRENPKIEIREVCVTQSSDEAFHCLAITVFYWESE